MTLRAAARGTSVADLLDQADDLLYAIAHDAPAGGRLLAAWPGYAAACSRLTLAAIGPRASGHAALTRPAEADHVLATARQLADEVGRARLAKAGAVPDVTMARVTELIGAAADLIECAHDRPGVWLRDAAQTDTFRRAGIVRAAELALTGLDLTVRACGRSHQSQPWTAPNTKSALTSRATPLFAIRRQVVAVLDAAEGKSHRTTLDDVAIPAMISPRQVDPLGRLHAALRGWKAACLATAQSPAVSSAELQRASVEVRQMFAIMAALTDAARGTGDMATSQAVLTMTRLQRAGLAWSTVTTAWTHYTTGVPPSEHHVQASLELQNAIRSISRGEGGAWLPPKVLAAKIDLPAALDVVHRGLGDVLDVARTHDDAVDRIVRSGQVFAHAARLPLTEERVASRLQGRHAPITAAEGGPLRGHYVRGVRHALAAHAEIAGLMRFSGVTDGGMRRTIRAGARL